MDDSNADEPHCVGYVESVPPQQPQPHTAGIHPTQRGPWGGRSRKSAAPASELSRASATEPVEDEPATRTHAVENAPGVKYTKKKFVVVKKGEITVDSGAEESVMPARMLPEEKGRLRNMVCGGVQKRRHLPIWRVRDQALRMLPMWGAGLQRSMQQSCHAARSQPQRPASLRHVSMASGPASAWTGITRLLKNVEHGSWPMLTYY